MKQDAVIQEGNYIRVRVVGTRVDANDIVSASVLLLVFYYVSNLFSLQLDQDYLGKLDCSRLDNSV